MVFAFKNSKVLRRLAGTGVVKMRSDRSERTIDANLRSFQRSQRKWGNADTALPKKVPNFSRSIYILDLIICRDRSSSADLTCPSIDLYPDKVDSAQTENQSRPWRDKCVLERCRSEALSVHGYKRVATTRSTACSKTLERKHL